MWNKNCPYCSVTMDEIDVSKMSGKNYQGQTYKVQGRANFKCTSEEVNNKFERYLLTVETGNMVNLCELCTLFRWRS